MHRELTDEDIVRAIKSDPARLDRMSLDTVLLLWNLKARRNPVYAPIKELVRENLKKRIYS